MTTPPNPTEPPMTRNGCLWIAFISLVLWFVIIYLARKGMT